MRLLLDTNVLLDYYLKREPFFENAVVLRIAQTFGDVELWACAQSFADAEYVMRKFASRQKVRSVMAASLEFLNVCSAVGEDVASGLSSNWDELEDYLIACAADRVEADYLVTRDLHGFAQSKVPAMSLDGIVALFRDEYGLEYEPLGSF